MALLCHGPISPNWVFIILPDIARLDVEVTIHQFAGNQLALQPISHLSGNSHRLGAWLKPSLRQPGFEGGVVIQIYPKRTGSNLVGMAFGGVQQGFEISAVLNPHIHNHAHPLMTRIEHKVALQFFAASKGQDFVIVVGVALKSPTQKLGAAGGPEGVDGNFKALIEVIKLGAGWGLQLAHLTGAACGQHSSSGQHRVGTDCSKERVAATKPPQPHQANGFGPTRLGAQILHTSALLHCGQSGNGTAKYKVGIELAAL
jgi:hypothetical protein